MEIIKLEDLSIDEIVESLLAGKTIVYPTETCYGLGCDATNEVAVDKIFDIKKRQKEKPLLVVMPDVGMAMEYIEWNGSLERLAGMYWPGPLTVVAELDPDSEAAPLASGVVGPDGTLAFRVTGHPTSYELAASLSRPLVSTSANIAAAASAYDIESVLAMFQDEAIQPDIIIDAGELVHKSPSTIVRVGGGQIEVLRQGEIIVEDAV